jgi:hypothetical protein
MSGELARGWKPNERGQCPAMAKGRRVKVKLRNGMIDGAEPIASGTPAGWRADETALGKGPAMDWRLRNSPLDVVEWDFVN